MVLFFSMTNGQLYTVFGTITDFKSGEQLIGANIFLEKENVGTISNSYGFYSLKLPAGSHTLVFSYLGRIGQYIGIRGLRDFNDNNEINFYDLNAKFNYKLNNKNRVYLSAYKGRDHFYYFVIDNNSSMDWGNMTGTLRWNHIFNFVTYNLRIY